MDQERIIDLLERWEELQSKGEAISVEELCVECPELLEEVRIRIRILNRNEWLKNPGDELEDKEPPAPPNQLGRYRLDERIGYGGFAQVWRAFDPELERSVAIKVFYPEQLAFSGQPEQFLEEARKVAKLDHPGIITIHEVGREGNHCYLVTKLANGGTLADQIAKGPVPVKRSLEWVAQLADALNYAHTKSIVHRDIKPSNILLSKDDKPFVADFGIAIHEDEPRHERSRSVGTPAYMSPEQIKGQVVDLRTDIYSLGVVLYELLTGQRAFPGENKTEIIAAVLSGKPKPPRAIVESVPKRVEEICLKAMGYSPDSRYLTAKAFADDVRAYLNPRGPLRKVAVVGSTVVLILGLLLGRWAWNAREDARATGQKVQQQTTQVQDRVNSVLADVEKSYGIPRPKASSNVPSPESKPETPAREKGLPRLSFSDTTVDLTGHDLTDADFEQLGQHIVLRRLVLTNTPTTDAQLDQLRSVPGLERLDLAGTHVSDAGVEKLTNFAALQDLSLARTSITDASLKPIGSVRLRVLDLSNTKITDVGVKHLARRYGTGDSLTDLNLAGTSITDSCVSSLTSMPRLVRLVVTETKLSEEAVKQLQAALPKCQVER